MSTSSPGPSTSGSSLDVVVIGSCMIDLISYVQRLPKPGETLHGHTFTQGFGGKGANQCVMAARLGARCAMVGKLGKDSFGHSTIQNFKENGVSTEFVSMTSEVPSGVASITVNDQGENVIVIVSGANAALEPSEVQEARDMVARAKVVVCQLEIAPKTTLAALKMAKELGVTTILNTAPGINDLDKEFFENTDILCLNETEAEILTGLPTTDITTATEAIQTLQARGTRCIVLTMGERGLLYTHLLTKQEEGTSSEWSGIKHVEAEKEVNVVDTTGAGDAFVGALAYYLATSPTTYSNITEDKLENFLKRSGAVASHTVGFRGTQASYDVHTLKKELLLISQS